MTLRASTSISIALFSLMFAASGCQSTSTSTGGSNDEANQPKSDTTGAAKPKADEVKPDAKAAATKLDVVRPASGSLCAEFTGSDVAKFIPSLPKDTDTESMTQLFSSREALAKVFGACTAPASDAFDFSKNHVAYLRTSTCNVYDGFEGIELTDDTITIIAKKNYKEVACLNLGHFWFQVPPVQRDILVRAID